MDGTRHTTCSKAPRSYTSAGMPSTWAASSCGRVRASACKEEGAGVRCRANLAEIRQLRSNSGLGLSHFLDEGISTLVRYCESLGGGPYG